MGANPTILLANIPIHQGVNCVDYDTESVRELARNNTLASVNSCFRGSGGGLHNLFHHHFSLHKRHRGLGTKIPR